MRRARALVASILIAAACGPPRLPTPDYAPHPTSALTEVPFPPPPARVEMIPKQPDGDAVWVDGEWLWQSRRYGWKPGRWVKPPAGARFSPWTAVRDRTGTLFVAAGAWRDAKGGEVDEPPPLAAGSPQPTAIVSPEGDDLPRGPTIPLDAGPRDEPADAGAPPNESETLPDASAPDAKADGSA